MSEKSKIRFFQTDEKIGNKILSLSDLLAQLLFYIQNKQTSDNLEGNIEKLKGAAKTLQDYLKTLSRQASSLGGQGDDIQNKKDLDEYLKGRSVHEYLTFFIYRLNKILETVSSSNSEDIKKLKEEIDFIQSKQYNDMQTNSSISIFDNDQQSIMKQFVKLPDTIEYKDKNVFYQYINKLKSEMNKTKYLPDPLEKLHNQQKAHDEQAVLTIDSASTVDYQAVDELLKRYVGGVKIYGPTTSGLGHEISQKSMQQTVFEQHGEDVEIQQPIMALLNNLVGDVE